MKVAQKRSRSKVEPYSFGQYSISFESYHYPRIPQTSPRYALQRYNKRYDPGYDLDTLGYGGKSTIATIQKARPWYTSVLPFCFFSNFTARSSIFGSSTLRDAEQAKKLVLNSPRILLNYKNGKICVSYPEDTLHIQGRIHIQIFYLRTMTVAVVCLDSC